MSTKSIRNRLKKLEKIAVGGPYPIITGHTNEEVENKLDEFRSQWPFAKIPPILICQKIEKRHLPEGEPSGSYGPDAAMFRGTAGISTDRNETARAVKSGPDPGHEGC